MDIVTSRLQTDVQPPNYPEHQTPDVIGLVTTSREHPGPFQGCEQAGRPRNEQRRLPWRPMRPWHEQRGHPWSKIAITDQKDVFFPAVTRNAEISRGEAIELSHGSDLTPTNLEVEEAAKEPEAHPEHNCNCGYRSSGHDHAKEFSQHDA